MVLYENKTEEKRKGNKKVSERETEEIRKNTIRQILEREWEFFQETKHTEGRAECQDNYGEFIIMRESQWVILPLEVLRSYLDDLIIARHGNCNPIVEKYARMMEYSAPEEFEKIKEFLPEVSQEKREAAEKILKVYMKWEQEVMEKYPNLAKKGRPLYSEGDTPDFTSIETYLRGELLSYSLKTLKRYLIYIDECTERKVNLAERNLEEIVARKGYRSLEEVEYML